MGGWRDAATLPRQKRTLPLFTSSPLHFTTRERERQPLPPRPGNHSGARDGLTDRFPRLGMNIRSRLSGLSYPPRRWLVTDHKP
jgi:hypothetical protein